MSFLFWTGFGVVLGIGGWVGWALYGDRIKAAIAKVRPVRKP